jgi:uncharacterized membrane protein YcfT
MTSKPSTSTNKTLAQQVRVDWVDYAKGVCILAVVIFYCAGTVQASTGEAGWMRYLVDFAHPFRMPDFFLVAGLFVSRVLDRPWRSYADTKIVHFLYFYVLWITIEFLALNWRLLLEWEPVEALAHYAILYIQPEGHLWFIYMLPAYFLATRLLRGVPAGWVIAAAIVLKLANPETGWKMIDRFGMYFVFFYCGHVFAPYLFRLAELCRTHPKRALVVLALWCVVNGIAVKLTITDVPVVHLVMGFSGALAVLIFSALVAGMRSMEWLRYIGQHSIVVYLAFFFPMIVARKIIMDFQLLEGPGNIAFAITVLSTLGAFMIYWAVRRTPLRFLFERPQWATLKRPEKVEMKKAYKSV